MPRPYPPEFRQRAVELARQATAPAARIAKDLIESTWPDLTSRWPGFSDQQARRAARGSPEGHPGLTSSMPR